MPSDELVVSIAKAYRERQCDGVYLPVVSHDGIRLPVNRILQALKANRPVKFAVADASQAVAHVPDDLGVGECDVVISGTHKWLEAGMPMGVAFLSPLAEWALKGFALDDALCRFTNQLTGFRFPAPMETVNVWPLLSCAGALASCPQPVEIRRRFLGRLNNAAHLAKVLGGSGWTLQLPESSLRSGIVLVRSPGKLPKLVELFADRGIALTALGKHTVRLTLPSEPFSIENSTFLADAFGQLTSEASREIYH